jgi:acyl-homoserine-lactone acylase
LLPALERRDFVQNSNDSAWLANPQHPLVGFSPYVSYSDAMQSVRTRYGLDRLTAELRAGRRMDLPRLQGMITDNEAYLADLILDDLMALCNKLSESANAEGTPVDAAKACAALSAWNRTANLDAGPGYLYFSAFVDAIHDMDAVWAVPFDARDPIHTPRGLNLANASSTVALRSALLQAMKTVEARGLAAGTRWGDVQIAVLGGEKIPIHGGDDALGLYNHIGTTPMEGGLLRVTEGATYLQAVTFERDGPRAEGFLVYSQSMNPDSPREADQARRFSRKQWIALPFTESQIVSDPDYSTRRLTQ